MVRRFVSRFVNFVNRGRQAATNSGIVVRSPRVNWARGMEAIERVYPQSRPFMGMVRKGASLYRAAKGAFDAYHEAKVNETPLTHSRRALSNKIVPVFNKGTGVTTSSYVSRRKVGKRMSDFLQTLQKTSIKNTQYLNLQSTGLNLQAYGGFRYLEFNDLDLCRQSAFLGDTLSPNSPIQTGNLAGQNFRQGRMIVGAATCQATLTSTSDANIVVTIYDLVCKHDMANANLASTPTGAWSSGLASNAYNSGLGTLISPTTIGCRPWESDLFNAYWAVSKTTVVHLPAGATHIHKISVAPFASIPNYRETQSFDYAMVTRAILLVVKGTPVHSIAASATIATGTAGIDLVFDKWITAYANNKGLTTRTDVSPYATFADPGVIGDNEISEEPATTI